MKRTIITLAALMAFSMSDINADDVFKQERSRWLEIAEQSKPKLHRTVVYPKSIVKAVKDNSAFQGWRYEPTGKPEDVFKSNFRQMCNL